MRIAEWPRGFRSDPPRNTLKVGVYPATRHESTSRRRHARRSRNRTQERNAADGHRKGGRHAVRVFSNAAGRFLECCATATTRTQAEENASTRPRRDAKLSSTAPVCRELMKRLAKTKKDTWRGRNPNSVPRPCQHWLVFRAERSRSVSAMIGLVVAVAEGEPVVLQCNGTAPHRNATRIFCCAHLVTEFFHSKRGRLRRR